MRWSRSGTGKRGGARVIYFYHHTDAPIYLLLAYAKASRAAMSLDIEPFRHHLAGSDLTDAQQVGIIRSIYLVMESFVDLAFGMDATQISLGINCDQDGVAGLDALSSETHLPSTFNDAAARFAAGKQDHDR